MNPPPRFVQPVNQHAFVIGLAAFHLQAQRMPLPDQPRFDIGQGIVAVNLWLARAEQVQVRAVEDKDFAQRGCFRQLNIIAVP